MIDKFVRRWEERKYLVRAEFEANHPDSYEDIVAAVVRALVPGEDEYEYGGDWPDPKRITSIDHGHYQGTLVFVVGAGGYQPSTYWATRVSYGSCSGCDTLQGINGYSEGPPTKNQVGDYMTLALHILQGFKEI